MSFSPFTSSSALQVLRSLAGLSASDGDVSLNLSVILACESVTGTRYDSFNKSLWALLDALSGSSSPSLNSAMYNFAVVYGYPSWNSINWETLGYPYYASTLVKPIGSTFTRSSVANAVNSSGTLAQYAVDEMAFNFIGGEAYIMMEPARTNIILRSQEFQLSTWAKSQTTATADATTAPDGTTTADKIAEDTNALGHRVWQYPVTITAGAKYTFSVFLKANGRTKGSLVISNGATAPGPYAYFDLTSGTITATGATGTGAAYDDSGIEILSNGWHRVWVSGNTVAASTDGCPVIRLHDDTDNPSYTGDGTSGMYMWGAQLEAGVLASSYIPTTTASVSRTKATLDLTLPKATGNDVTLTYDDDSTQTFSSVADGYTLDPDLMNRFNVKTIEVA